MLKVSVHQARDGMVVALPVLHPRRPEVVLLRPGAVLDPHTIAKMRELGLGDVWVRYPRLDRLGEYLSPGIVQACAAVTGQIRRALDSVISDAHARLDYVSYRRAVAGLLEKFCDHPKAAMFVQELGDGSAPALRHASNVCLLSVLLGLKLDFYLVQERTRLSASSAKDVSNLGVGAMLHDIGMLRLTPEVRARWEHTQDDTDPSFREHVRVGYDLVRDQVEPSAATVVLHHHQAFDGSGFPVRKEGSRDESALAGQQIHIFARIVACADLFTRLRSHHRREGEAAAPAVRALRMILRPEYACRLDPMIVRGLFNVVPAYAPGTIVILSSGHECVVTDWSCLEPCRPVVETLVDRRVEPEVFDLRIRRDLFIARAEGCAVAEDNFELPEPHAFDLSHAPGYTGERHAAPRRRKAG